MFAPAGLRQSAPMHLIIPYAASHAFSDPQALAGLALPHLQTLLGLLQRQQVLRDGDDAPVHMPHERLQAQILGWVGAHDPTAQLPWAAWHSAQQGEQSHGAQAWMTPCHWQIGMDQVIMLDPDSLQLSDEESRQLLLAMQPFLQEDGLQVRWHSALRWHAQGTLLAGVPTASLDRVIGQNVKPWMHTHPAARPLQRLQSEMQMLLYNHPVNNAREARRQVTVNAFWLHGAGTLPNAAPTDKPTERPLVQLPEALRASALHADLPAWQQAWQALDASAVAELLQHFRATGQATLSLCSENTAHTYQAAAVAWHQRIRRLFKPSTPEAALTALITP